MNEASAWVVGIFMTVVLIAGGLIGCPQYKVYSERMNGEAALAEAQSSRQIKTLEAKAKLESAEMLGQAEVIRAKGAAKANKILGESLKNNEAYLRYLWIEKLDSKGEVIYIPTEAGMPILEAGKRGKD